MSLGGTLRGLAAEIGKNRTPTGAEAAPAKLRHRTGTIDAYTVGALTASVQVGADVVDAPFVGSYTPAAGDAVSVLINNGSPLILGAVNKLPATGGAGMIASAEFIDSAVGPTNGVLAHGAEFGTLTGDGDTTFADIAPVSGSQNAARILQPGWYSVHIWASFGGLATGDHVQVEATCAYFSQSCTGGGAFLPLGPTTVAAGSITPFYLYPGDQPIEILGAAYGPGTAYVQALHLFIAKQTGLAV